MREKYLNVMLALPFAASVLGAGEAAAAPSACDAIAGNLVTNCGFETTADWSPQVAQDTQSPHTGSFAELLNVNSAYLNSTDHLDATLVAPTRSAFGPRLPSLPQWLHF